MIKHLLTVLVLTTAAIPAHLSAHHSFAAEFDYDNFGSIEGEVIEVLFVNPHARYFIAITNTEGEEEVWDTQTMSISALTRFGWVGDTIQIGDHVVLEGNMGRDDTRKLWIRKVTMGNGRVITPTPGGTEYNE
jgi:hypothetical protein